MRKFNIILFLIAVLLATACNAGLDANDDRLIYQIRIIDENQTSQGVIEGVGEIKVSAEPEFDDGVIVRYIIMQRESDELFNQLRIILSGNDEIEFVYQEVFTEVQNGDRLFFKP